MLQHHVVKNSSKQRLRVSPDRSIGSRMTDLTDARSRPDLLIRWLWLVGLMVFSMVVVGGITRLTESGLSITEWQPIVGTLPPLSEADWESAFAKYRATPEYEQVNKGMALSEFKGIFWWEYIHRLLGRLIGLDRVPATLPALRRAPRPGSWRCGLST